MGIFKKTPLWTYALVLIIGLAAATFKGSINTRQFQTDTTAQTVVGISITADTTAPLAPTILNLIQETKESSYNLRIQSEYLAVIYINGISVGTITNQDGILESTVALPLQKNKFLIHAVDYYGNTGPWTEIHISRGEGGETSSRYAINSQIKISQPASTTTQTTTQTTTDTATSTDIIEETGTDTRSFLPSDYSYHYDEGDFYESSPEVTSQSGETQTNIESVSSSQSSISYETQEDKQEAEDSTKSSSLNQYFKIFEEKNEYIDSGTFIVSNENYTSENNSIVELIAKINIFKTYSESMQLDSKEKSAKKEAVRLKMDGMDNASFIDDTDQDGKTDAYEIISGGDPNEAEPEFDHSTDIVEQDGTIYSSENFYIYGQAPLNYTVNLYMQNSEREKILIDSQTPDENGKYTLEGSFEYDGSYELILETVDSKGMRIEESSKGTVTYDSNLPEMPIALLDFYDYSELENFSTDLLKVLNSNYFFLNGLTVPATELSVILKNSEANYLFRAYSHPESGEFNITNQNHLKPGEYMAIVQSLDPATSIKSAPLLFSFLIKENLSFGKVLTEEFDLCQYILSILLIYIFIACPKKSKESWGKFINRLIAATLVLYAILYNFQDQIIEHLCDNYILLILLLPISVTIRILRSDK